ncbi:MAG TPA: NAD(P)-dependent oxidoreductase [Methylobacter sp.]|jgi:nucleoside-diphosphate-sugar epimerase
MEKMALIERKSIVVTGANGLLGRNAIEELSKRHEIHAVVRAIPDSPVSGVSYHIVDLASDWDWGSLPKKTDAVFHLAQSKRMREFPEQALDIYQVNLGATAKLLDYARSAGAAHFVFTSTGGLYGAGAQAFGESSPLCSPEGVLKYYFDTKYCGEILAKNYADFMGVVILRPFFIYGPGQNSTMLVPRLINSVRKRQLISINGETGIRINPIYVSDAVIALEATLGLQGQHTINIAGPEIVTLRRLVEAIGEAMHIKPIFNFSAGEPQDVVADINLMSQLLTVPVTRVVSGINRLIQCHDA